MSTEDRDLLERTLRRREALVTLGGLGAGVVWAATRGSAGLARAAVAAPHATAAATTCVLTPEVTEGPYWISNRLTRRNIKDGRPGLTLALYITVVDATTCKPITGADVEIWHADAGGAYSGYSASSPPSGGGHAAPNNSRRYLRGHQKSDVNGRVRFDTIYPGWYRGRTPHIHMKVHVGGAVVHTGQLFFADATSRAVYRTSRYRSHGLQDTTNRRDGIYAQAGGSKALVHLARRNVGGYNGSITVGVRR
jgi:protocatechuate 3,4-dioxygenase beta subunit